MSLNTALSLNNFPCTIPGIFCKTAKTFPDRVAFRDIQRLKDVDEGVKQANLLADSQAQCVQKITLVPKNFSVANGLLTLTQKLKRSIIEKHFEDDIKKMYQDKS